MFLLVPAYPGSPGQKAVKRLCVCVCGMSANEQVSVQPSTLAVNVTLLA